MLLVSITGVASRRLAASRAILFAAATAPLGQDSSELFKLYEAPKYECAPLLAGQEPTSLDVFKARGDVHRDGDWHRSVHIWLIDEEDRMVLQRRSEHKDTHPGLLDVSCAGHITGDDSVLSTAVRELEEELGLSLSAEEIEAAWVCTLPSSASGATAKHGEFVCKEFQEIFIIDGWDGQLNPDAFGADEVAGVELVDAAKVLAAWDDDHPEYVPRPDHYRRVLGSALGFFPKGGW